MKDQGLGNSPEFHAVNLDDLLYKRLLNNGYGVWAINPRNFKEHYLTDPDELPPDEWFRSTLTKPMSDEEWHKVRAHRLDNVNPEYALPLFESDAYWIWQKPAPMFRFKNVGVSASITGAQRAVLMEAIHHAVDPIYCDTDSLICRELPGVELDPVKLGAWDLEDSFKSVIINGKKLYACQFDQPKVNFDGQITQYKIRTKGTAGLTWTDMEAMLTGDKIEVSNFAPTFTKFSTQYYVKREISATAKQRGLIQ